MKGQEFVRYALDMGAIKFSRKGFKLHTGRTSPYYVTTGAFCTAESSIIVGEAFAALAQDPEVDVFFGPAYQGIPLSQAAAVGMYRRYGRNAGFAYNRKEEKQRGDGGILAGASMKGKRVYLVDNAISSGRSAREAFNLVSGARGAVIGFGIAFDRQESVPRGGGMSGVWHFEKKFGVPVQSLATLEDLILVLEAEHSERAAEFLPLIKKYRRRYGVAS